MHLESRSQLDSSIQHPNLENVEFDSLEASVKAPRSSQSQKLPEIQS